MEVLGLIPVGVSMPEGQSKEEWDKAVYPPLSEEQTPAEFAILYSARFSGRANPSPDLPDGMVREYFPTRRAPPSLYRVGVWRENKGLRTFSSLAQWIDNEPDEYEELTGSDIAAVSCKRRRRPARQSARPIPTPVRPVCHLDWHDRPSTVPTMPPRDPAINRAAEVAAIRLEGEQALHYAIARGDMLPAPVLQGKVLTTLPFVPVARQKPHHTPVDPFRASRGLKTAAEGTLRRVAYLRPLAIKAAAAPGKKRVGKRLLSLLERTIHGRKPAKRRVDILAYWQTWRLWADYTLQHSGNASRIE
jgi:hypothetical protein